MIGSYNCLFWASDWTVIREWQNYRKDRIDQGDCKTHMMLAHTHIQKNICLPQFYAIECFAGHTCKTYLYSNVHTQTNIYTHTDWNSATTVCIISHLKLDGIHICFMSLSLCSSLCLSFSLSWSWLGQGSPPNAIINLWTELEAKLRPAS